MNDWNVILSADFKAEVRAIRSYIADVLSAPLTAARYVRRIIDAVKALSEMPLRYSLYDKEPWRGRGLRKLIVDNFVVFYWTNEQAKEVVAFHVFYGGRNIEECLQ